MWQKALQTSLGVTADGVLGPKSYAALFRKLGARSDRAEVLGQAAAKYLPQYGISVGPKRLTEWFGEMAHESTNFNALEENLNYTTYAALKKAFGLRFPTPQSAIPYLRNPKALGNFVYANRNGNGSVESGDGYNFRGRSPIHLTGQDNYELSAQKTGLPLLTQPDLASKPEYGVMIAAEWWRRHGLNERADRGESRAISGIINRGSPTKIAHGLSERQAKKNSVQRLWSL